MLEPSGPSYRGHTDRGHRLPPRDKSGGANNINHGGQSCIAKDQVHRVSASCAMPTIDMIRHRCLSISPA